MVAIGSQFYIRAICHSTGKCIKTHCMVEPGKLVLILFSIVWVIFSHNISILWYASPYWKCMGFLMNFPYFTWYSYFSHRFLFYGILYYMGNACVFSSISHNMGKDSQTHGIRKVWEIVSREYPKKSIVWGEPGKLILILFS